MSIEIIEVDSKKLMKEFVQFPIKLYKDYPQFIPIFTGDEMKMLNEKKNPTLKDCEAKYFVARSNGRAVGRIGAILHKSYNERVGCKKVRFTRFDCIDDLDVARALFCKVENFAKTRGMNIVHGPYGFNETDRSGYLIEGFSHVANVGTNYNFPYYDKLIEACGYQKESGWDEIKVLPGQEVLDKLTRASQFVLSHSDYRIANEKKFKGFAKKYGWKAFQCLNDAYSDLPGFIPFTKEHYDQIAAQFGLVINTRYMCAVLNKEDDVVGFAVCFPSIGQAVQKSKGNIFPLGVFRILHALKHVKTTELCLIGVKKEYQSRGVNAVMIHHILKNFMEDGIESAEAYPQYEQNAKTLSQWKHFETEIIKKRKIVEKTL